MPLSRFIPEDFDPTRPVAVIAGRGRYPVLTVAALRAVDVPVRLIAFEGETEESLYQSFAEGERARIKVGQVGKMLKHLQKLGAGYAIMAGQITPRRLFDGMQPDLKAVRMLASLKERNAETIFGAIAQEIAAIGVCQLDARAFLDAHVATEGAMTPAAEKIDADALTHGIRIAREVARLDIGQGVVVARGTVLAVEAFEGTDKMLTRAGDFGAKEALFVKTSKPGQDYRFDVPVFGERTLEKMLAAGIRAAAVEAGNTLILGREELLKEARKNKVALLGY